LDKIKFLFQSISGKLILVVLASILLLVIPIVSAAEKSPSRADETAKQKIVRQVGQKWIEVGIEQYRKGFYKVAEQSFLRAQDYQDYLTAAEREKLNELLEKAHLSALERARILEHIQKADELVKRGELIKAKAHLERVKNNESLTKDERELIIEGLNKINSQLKASLEDKLPESVVSREIAESEDRLLGADADVEPFGVLEGEPARKADLQMVQESGEPMAVPIIAEPAPEEDSYIAAVNRKRNILRGHTRAVVNDAIANGQNYISRGEFDKAREAVETAERTVNENYLQLGEHLFKQYGSELKQLTEKIIQGENEKVQKLQEQMQLEAIEAQQRFREQMEADRDKRISDLMDNAMAYQKQQRYEEALGQLESLLAIEPLNDQALILKQTLDDMIGFRKQLEVRKEADKERVGILLKADEAGIPYAEEITHPKNWREIAAKRKPEEAIGQDPANVAVYKQLDEVVDLSRLSPEMSFSDAIEELKTAATPPLKIVVLWRDLYDNADIDQTTAINMDPISAVPLGAALKLLLEAVSGGFATLGYDVRSGVITIATVESLPGELETFVYDVSTLVGRPADFYARSGGGASGRGGRGGSGGSSGGSRGGSSGSSRGGGGREDFGEFFYEEEEEYDREQLAEQATARAESLRVLIQETIEPDSWFDTGGEGTITFYENKKLVVRQTREIHNKIEKLLKDMRKSLGHQIAIEARFLLVGENFLEDIGVGVDFDINLGGKFGFINIRQNSSASTKPESTGVMGSWGGDTILDSLTASGGYGSILDDLQVSFLIRATQAHKDSRALTAPKVSVLSGESATMRVQRTIRYALQPDITTRDRDTGSGYSSRSSMYQNYGEIPTGTLLNITPTITADKKHVLLNIVTELRDFLGFEDTEIEVPNLEGTTAEPLRYTVTLPQTEISRVQTRVTVPDGGTLLLGGQKVTEEIEKEVGVPILSKIPVIGRLFNNRSKVKDHKILLILVKPTIILQEEKDAEALASMDSMESGF
jgi:type II secretory pathway component GspD/PulD (secretin)/tetratricopeptide (TPR) repeat protein